MQINKVENLNFGARPCELTRKFLINLEEQGINTSKIIGLMKDMYVGGSIKSELSYFKDGEIFMNLFSKDGKKLKSIFKLGDDIYAHADTLTLKNPNDFMTKLHDRLMSISTGRSKAQKIQDKINGPFEI